jgi:peptidoglycan/xylan/chitin deacetylase (PgdA/CDA1 family)
MFHSIRGDGKPVSEGNNIDITSEQFSMFTGYAKQMGFETITAAQLSNFLQNNSRIPARSLLMIVDDRRAGTVEDFFLPVLEKNQWTVTLGWIIGDTNEALWSRMERLNATGRLDVQSHGYNHIYITDQTPEEQVRQEIFDPIRILEQHFGQRPTAFIWPGGNFTTQSVQLARQAGYQLGFTAFSRGPLMFNWIPQGAEERAVGDPLMTLPRFWSPDLTLSLDIGMRIGEAAQAEAMENYPEEAEYYSTYCAGELPQPNP